ncbi:MAG: DinB family protein [Theionarchaea archaeon]|nr:DinB family protein [Theionarchaea archaeon]
MNKGCERMSQNVSLIKLCDHQIWADSLIRDTLHNLPEEEFTQEIGPPFGSVKNLCVHIVLALEYNMKSLIEKVPVNGEELYETIGSLSKDELLATWEDMDKKLKENAKQVHQLICFPNFISGGDVLMEPGDFFLQYILHTTYHRGQLVSMLKLLGKEGVTTDYLFYMFNLEE